MFATMQILSRLLKTSRVLHMSANCNSADVPALSQRVNLVLIVPWDLEFIWETENVKAQYCPVGNERTSAR
jgi:hypothetical protein